MFIAHVGLMQMIRGAMTEQALHKCSSLGSPGTGTLHTLEWPQLLLLVSGKHHGQLMLKESYVIVLSLRTECT
jgi:hypothetical protein